MKIFNFIIEESGRLRPSIQQYIVQGENNVSKITVVTPTSMQDWETTLFLEFEKPLIDQNSNAVNKLAVVIPNEYIISQNMANANIQKISFVLRKGDQIFPTTILSFPELNPTIQDATPIDPVLVDSSLLGGTNINVNLIDDGSSIKKYSIGWKDKLDRLVKISEIDGLQPLLGDKLAISDVLEGENIVITREGNRLIISSIGVTGDGGTRDHRVLAHRDAADQHPLGAISGLLTELNEKLDDVPTLTNLEIEELLNNFV